MSGRLGLWVFHGGEPHLVSRGFQEAWESLTNGLESELDRELLPPEVKPEELIVAAGSTGFFSPGRVVGVRGWHVLGSATRARRGKPGGQGEAERAAELLEQLPEGASVILSAPGT